jgi:hypothetical protein
MWPQMQPNPEQWTNDSWSQEWWQDIQDAEIIDTDK